MSTPAPLISVDELAAADAATLLVIDCRFSLADPAAGRAEYRAAHIPGAVYASLDADLTDAQATDARLGRHPLPTAQAFALTLGRWGWHDGLTAIAYDAGSGAMAAARAWWLMRWMGAPARVLDGGLAAWRAAGEPVESGDVERAPTEVEVHFDADRVVSVEQLRDLLAADAITLVDARAAARFRGESEPIDPVAGHVPGARNHPFADNVDADQHLLSGGRLREEFAQLTGGRDAGDVVHMCGSGVTACHNLLAMEQAGLHGSRLYAPSWSGWCADPDNPVATGSS